MSPLLGPVGLLLAVFAGSLALDRLGHVSRWSRRSAVQLGVLAAPLLGLSLGIAGVHHATGRLCPLGAPPWDYRLDVGVVLLMELGAVGGLAFGLGRLALLLVVMARRGVDAPGELQAKALALADQLGVRRPRLRICAQNRPLALTWGLRQPTVLLSTWMLERLDECELEAVLAHELAHVLRRDFLTLALAALLRDAFFYLPTSRAAHRLLQAEKEPACDDLAVRATKRPLALASALARVWEDVVGGTTPVPALTDGRGPIEERIVRLMHGSTRFPDMDAAHPSTLEGGGRLGRVFAPGVGLSAAGALAALAVSGSVALLSPMSCSAMTPLARLF